MMRFKDKTEQEAIFEVLNEEFNHGFTPENVTLGKPVSVTENANATTVKITAVKDKGFINSGSPRYDRLKLGEVVTANLALVEGLEADSTGNTDTVTGFTIVDETIDLSAEPTAEQMQGFFTKFLAPTIGLKDFAPTLTKKTWVAGTYTFNVKAPDHYVFFNEVQLTIVGTVPVLDLADIINPEALEHFKEADFVEGGIFEPK